MWDMDNYLFPGLCDVAITTYEVDMKEMARQTVHTLIRKMAGEPYRQGICIVEGHMVTKGQRKSQKKYGLVQGRLPELQSVIPASFLKQIDKMCRVFNPYGGADLTDGEGCRAQQRACGFQPDPVQILDWRNTDAV